MTKKVFVAMAGNIGAGKTTAAKMISQKFGFELFDEPVVDNRFLADYYKDMKRWSFTLQLEFLMKRVQHHELIHKVPKSCIQDRTLYEDPEVFAKYLHGLGHLGNNELDLYFEYFERLTRGLHHPEKVICFVVPAVPTLRRRIEERGRAEEKSMYYTAFPVILREKYKCDVLSLDVSAMDIRIGDGREKFLADVDRFLRA
jgi:deoxyadenosine/deoxycytidine kinase